MSVLSAVPVAEIKARGSIKDADVLKLRRDYYDDGRITDEEADAIFALHDACPVRDPAWADYFVEAITDYIVDQAKPEGYLNAANASWLIRRIAKTGRIETKIEMELLIGVLESARWVPQGLVRFALDQVKQAIATGTGPLRAGAQPDTCRVTGGDIDLLRRIICSYGRDGSIALTRPEAEVLFDIDAATIGADNHPAWRDLFVKAMVTSVMGASGYAMSSRADALERDPWLHRPGPFPYIAGLGAYRRQTPEERAIARLALQKVEIVTHEPVTVADASWLAQRMSGDGAQTPNVRALLAFLKAEGPAVHPTVQALVDKAAAAA
jgi:hypothetical protein